MISINELRATIDVPNEFGSTDHRGVAEINARDDPENKRADSELFFLE